jgi:hypothetical protein
MPGIAKNPQTGLVQDPLLESKALPDFLLGLTLMAASLLGGETPLACSISVQRANIPTVLASNSGRARRLDMQQHQVGEGPCLMALGGQSHVFVPDLQSNGGWASLADAARREGIRSVLAAPIDAGIPVKASLSCYSASPSAFEPSVIEAVQELARSMSQTVQIALRRPSRDAGSEKWRAALKSRAVVDGAVAVLISQDGSSRGEALSVLQRGARTSGEPLLEEAGKVIYGKFPRNS